MQLSEQRVRMLLKSGIIQGEQFGKQWVVQEQSVREFLSNPINHVNPADQVRRTTKKTKLNALSFFSGAMGMDLGLERAGIDIRLACEFDPACRKTIIANKPDVGLIGDVWNYTPAQIREYATLSPTDEIDLLVGGPPCQAFSTAGGRKGLNDERGNALVRYLQLIEELRPRYAVLENVRGLLSVPLLHQPHAERDASQKLSQAQLPGGVLLAIVNRLQQAGYGVSFNLYNSANFGTPQVRERVVLICHRDGSELPYLPPTHSIDEQWKLPKWVTFEEAVAGLPEKQHHVHFPEERLRYYRLLKPGQYWKNLPVDLQQQALGKSYFAGGGKTGFLRRLAWDKPAPTLVTHPAMPATDLAHPTLDRPLSIEEYKRLQQFPDDWIVCGSLVDQYRQIGNAVPLGLGEAIGKLILQHMNGKKIKTFPDFEYSRYRETDHPTWLAKHRALHEESRVTTKKKKKTSTNRFQFDLFEH